MAHRVKVTSYNLHDDRFVVGELDLGLVAEVVIDTAERGVFLRDADGEPVELPSVTLNKIIEASDSPRANEWLRNRERRREEYIPGLWADVMDMFRRMRRLGP